MTMHDNGFATVQQDEDRMNEEHFMEHDPMDPQHPPEHSLVQQEATAPEVAAPAARILAVRQPDVETSTSPLRLQKHASSAISPAAGKENLQDDRLSAAGVFRLAPHADARLEGNRVALKRGAFLKKRSEGGPQWAGVEAAGISCLRQMKSFDAIWITRPTCAGFLRYAQSSQLCKSFAVQFQVSAGPIVGPDVALHELELAGLIQQVLEESLQRSIVWPGKFL